MENSRLADIWGDTVDLRHLAYGMVLGIIIALAAYMGGVSYLKANYPKLPLNLVTGYSLLIGIVGCLLSAFIAAKLFPPKRELKEAELSAEDRLLVIEELKLDQETERRELETLPPEIVEEMKQLKLYDLFAGQVDAKEKGAS